MISESHDTTDGIGPQDKPKGIASDGLRSSGNRRWSATAFGFSGGFSGGRGFEGSSAFNQHAENMALPLDLALDPKEGRIA